MPLKLNPASWATLRSLASTEATTFFGARQSRRADRNEAVLITADARYLLSARTNERLMALLDRKA
jgi:hypothetical protein